MTAKGMTGLVNTNAFSCSRTTILFKKIVFNTDTGFFVEDPLNLSSTALDSIQSESIY
jgi:hypothetical protein